MKILFVHNNFPAQFRNVVEELRKAESFKLAAIGAQGAQAVEGVAVHRYQVPAIDPSATHPFARRFDVECRRAEQVLMAASALAASGFIPDFIIAHSGWGETLPLRAVFPKARIVIYCEFFYRAEGQDVHFDPEGPRVGVDGIAALQCKNASSLIALAEADAGISPTRWQRSTFPMEFQRKIEVVHEGVDLASVRPDPTARLTLPRGKVLAKTDEIVTFASRNLEPVRGYHVFLRSLPAILRARPEAQIVIAGGDGNSYSHAPPVGKTWKTHCLDEIVSDLDLSRVHFVGSSRSRLLLEHASGVVRACLPDLSIRPFLVPGGGDGDRMRDRRVGHRACSRGDRGPTKRRSRPLHDRSALSQAVIDVARELRRLLEARRAARTTSPCGSTKGICVQQALRAIGVDERGRARRTE